MRFAIYLNQENASGEDPLGHASNCSRPVLCSSQYLTFRNYLLRKVRDDCVFSLSLEAIGEAFLVNTILSYVGTQSSIAYTSLIYRGTLERPLPGLVWRHLGVIYCEFFTPLEAEYCIF